MNTDKLAINWKNFTQVRLQLKFAFIIRPKAFLQRGKQLLLTYCTYRNTNLLLQEPPMA